MPLRPNLLTEIDAALAGLPKANLNSASAGYDLYEAYIWALVLRAARNEGATIRFRNRHGNHPANFWFRTSPSNIFSPAHDYCHAEIEFPGRPMLEAHVGIFVAGRSHIAHECDVAVLYKSEADICRTSSVEPRSSKLVLAVECKYYLNSGIGIGLGRSFLGLLNDVYKGDRYFVGTAESPSVKTLFAAHRKNNELGLTPLNTRREARLVSRFETTFDHFKSSRP